MRGLHKTDIELLMEQALVANAIEAVPQFPIRCKYGYIADFAIPDKKIIIECDGEAWHKPKNSHDRKRDAYLRSQGWTILRFKGQQIKTDINSCLKIIQEKLKMCFCGVGSGSILRGMVNCNEFEYTNVRKGKESYSPSCSSKDENLVVEKCRVNYAVLRQSKLQCIEVGSGQESQIMVNHQIDNTVGSCPVLQAMECYDPVGSDNVKTGRVN